MRTIIALTIAALSINAANAQTFNTASVASPSQSLVETLNSVCQSDTLVLSTQAQIACESQQFPRLVADGSAFRNTGVGAEFNTLMRQAQ